MAERIETSPARKIGWAMLIGLLLAIPLFSVWLLVYDRQSQSREATEAITAGWGGRQTITAPLIAIPYAPDTATAAAQAALAAAGRGAPLQRPELVVAPESMTAETEIVPEVRRKSIYEAVVYTARVRGQARFVLPPDLARGGTDLARADFGRAEIRFGISDPRGIGANPRVTVEGRPLRLQPGGGSGSGAGFFAWVDAAQLRAGAITVDFAYDLRGSDGFGLLPRAGDTSWTVTSPWPSPSFEGGFLPARRSVSDAGFTAAYRVGNLAIGRTLAELREAGTPERGPEPVEARPGRGRVDAAEIGLVRPVDFYSRVDRSAKYGFLFIGFTFLALFLFDVVGGARVAAVEYLLTGAGLVLFFVLLLAFAEIIGFTFAYVVAAAAITGLITAYSAAVLKSWRRAQFIGALLVGLYGLLYVLLSLEAYSLLIGSLLLFAALAGVMYITRNIDWNSERGADA